MSYGYDNYPPGAANDPNAPWNEVSSPEHSFDVNITQILTKDTDVVTDRYMYIQDADEDGIYVEYNTEDTDWEDVARDNGVKTPLDLIALFKESLEKQLESGNLVFSERETKQLIEECEGWRQEDYYIEEQ